jgi:carbon monoxide dehydrogenase subunit G
MRFTGERSLAASADEVWEALHDHEVLRQAIPGCLDLAPIGPGSCAATLGVRVGPLSDVYRGRFDIHGHPSARSLRVSIEGRGRAGRLELDLQVELSPVHSRTTHLRYDARARVSGLVARLGAPTLSVAGAHITGCFFRDLDRALRSLTGSSTRSERVVVAV